jgi:uncharacterized membrane protein YqgA involved in biofilm formation
MRLTGALINAALVLAGGGAGLLLAGRISQNISDAVMRALGLCVLVIGLSGALTGDFIPLVVSLALGAITGELLGIDAALCRFGEWLQRKMNRGARGSFAEGFTSATLLFCVGAMAVVGSIDSGLRDDQSVIITKSVIDAVSAMVLASAYGVGVLFSALAVFVYQGSIEVFAGFMQSVMTEGLVTQITAAGSVMIMAIGFNMVTGARVKAANLLPGLLFAAAYYFVFANQSV